MVAKLCGLLVLVLALTAVPSGASARKVLQVTTAAAAPRAAPVAAPRVAPVLAPSLTAAASRSGRTVTWQVPANGQQLSLTVVVGEQVKFVWTSTHDVWQIPQAKCPTTFTVGAGTLQYALQTVGGSLDVPFNTIGTFYFTCSVPGHCAAGQLITIKVVAAGTALAPAPGASFGLLGQQAISAAGGPCAGSGYSGTSGTGAAVAAGYQGGTSSNYGSTGCVPATASGYAGSSGTGQAVAGGYAGGTSSNYGSGGAAGPAAAAGAGYSGTAGSGAAVASGYDGGTSNNYGSGAAGPAAAGSTYAGTSGTGAATALGYSGGTSDGYGSGAAAPGPAAAGSSYSGASGTGTAVTGTGYSGDDGYASTTTGKK